jgi:membrane associated rhomboid family serine protease
MHLSTTVIIIIITCLVSITGFYNHEELNKMILWPAMIKQRRQYYRFVTSGFIHAGWGHLAFNMITLYYFGRIVEVYFRELFGPGVFILFYLLSMIVADIHTYVKYRNDYSYRALGASGAVSAVLFASILFNPWAKLYVFFIPIGIPAFLFGIIYLAVTVYLDRKGGGNINHSAHLWGAVFGILFTIVLEPRVASFFLNQLAAGL